MPTTTRQFYRTCLVLPLLLMALFVVAENSQAQDNPAQPPTQLTEKLTLTENQLKQLGMITAIRSRMGGGITKQLEGVLPGVDTEQQTHELLTGMIKEQKPTVQSVSSFEALARLTKTSKDHDPNTPQAVLRSTAKDLEKLAANLEQVQFYDQADELRNTATSFWLQARKLD